MIKIDLENKIHKVNGISICKERKEGKRKEENLTIDLIPYVKSNSECATDLNVKHKAIF
jgi:hypothetical protein